MYTLSPVTERVQRLRTRYRDEGAVLDAERARLVTEFYQANDFEIGILRRAKMLKYICENKSIRIEKDELIVGNVGKAWRSIIIWPEYGHTSFLKEEFENGVYDIRDSTEENSTITPEDRAYIISIDDYWKNRNVTKRVDSVSPLGFYSNVLPSDCTLFFEYGKGGCPVGHYAPNYHAVLDKGFAAIKAEALQKMAEMEGRVFGDNAKRYTFYHAVAIVCDAIMTLAKRYGAKCRELAEGETDDRRRELLEMAESLDRIIEKPCRTFADAVQATFLYHMTLALDGQLHGLTIGRFDQFTWPYLKADLEEGRITIEKAQELVDCFYLKLDELVRARSRRESRENGSYSSGQHMSIGGQTSDGRDATNTVSYLMLQTIARLKLHEPPLSVRVHRGTPHELWTAAIETAKICGGIPTFQNDDVIIPALTSRGMSIEDARNYCIIGCMEPAGSGNEWSACGGNGLSTMLNLVSMLLIAINNGANPKTNIPAGPQTGYLYEMKTFEEVKDAYVKTVNYFVDWHITMNNFTELVTAQDLPVPLASATIEGCLDSGLDVMWGGAKYNSTGGAGVGCANIADSLSAIKYMIFDKKLCTAKELYDAIMANWEGYEVLREQIRNEVPRYGNDDPYVDSLARWAMDVFSDRFNAGTGPRGSYRAGLYPVTAHVGMGLGTWASPDGRKTGEPLADGVSPMQGMDKSGPTAALNSIAWIDHVNNGNGTQVNMRFHPNTVAGEEGTENLISLIEDFFHKGGMHIQFNVISTDVLRDAQKNPEEYKNLVIRVAGYSAYFVELYKDLQNDLINRTEQSL